MSRLVLQGDLISNFGKYLPAPYIEYIYTDGDKLEVQISIFLNVTEEQDVLSYVSFLSQAGLVFYVVGVPYDTSTTTGDAYTTILNNKNEIYNYMTYIDVASSNDYGNSTTWRNFLSFTLSSTYFGSDSEGNIAYEVFYDEDGNRIAKLTTSPDARGTGDNGGILFPPNSDGTDVESSFMGQSPYDYNVFVFSSLYQAPEDVYSWDRNTYNVDEHTGEKTQSYLFDTLTSDVAYEKVYENGILANRVEPGFFDSSDMIFDGEPLRSLDGGFFKTNNIKQETIVKDFQNLIDNTRALSTTDSETENMLNNMSYILSTSAQGTNLLTSLNDLRKVFPNKIPTNPTGILYRKFRKKIFTFNKIVQQQPKLAKRLVRNPKVIDNTPVTDKQFKARSDVWDGDPVGNPENYLYTKMNLFSRSDVDAAYRVNFGYFFFDYQKFLYEASNLALLIDVARFEQLFNVKVPYKTAYFKRAKISRTDTTTSDGDRTTSIYCNVNSNDAYPGSMSTFDADFKKFPYSQQCFHDTTHESNASWGQPYVDLSDGTQLASYIINRNFDALGAADTTGRLYLNGYRLVCYEFQDIMSLDLIEGDTGELGTAATEYNVAVSFVDNTHTVMRAMINQFLNAKDVFDDYYDLAYEQCSYNNIDGMFNNFFSEGITDRFANDTTQAPWYKMPTLFNVHRELVLNYFNGDDNAMEKNTKEIMESISPTNGTLAALDAFKTLLESFITDNYTS